MAGRQEKKRSKKVKKKDRVMLSTKNLVLKKKPAKKLID